MVALCSIEGYQANYYSTKALSKNDSPKTLGTRVSCKTGTWYQGIRVSGNLILSGEPLAKGYYKWHPERKEKKTYIQEYKSKRIVIKKGL